MPRQFRAALPGANPRWHQSCQRAGESPPARGASPHGRSRTHDSLGSTVALDAGLAPERDVREGTRWHSTCSRCDVVSKPELERTIYGPWGLIGILGADALNGPASESKQRRRRETVTQETGAGQYRIALAFFRERLLKRDPKRSFPAGRRQDPARRYSAEARKNGCLSSAQRQSANWQQADSQQRRWRGTHAEDWK